MTGTRTLLGLALLLSAGCQSHGAPLGGAVNTYRGGEGAPGVEDLGGNRELRDVLEIVAPRSERRDGFLFAQFQLENESSGSRWIEYSVEWFDASGFSLGSDDNWKRLLLPGSARETIQLVSPTRNAVAWELQVRKPTSIK